MGKCAHLQENGIAPRINTHYPKMQQAARDRWAQHSAESRAAFAAAGRLARLVAGIERHHAQLSDAQRQRVLAALAE